MFPASFFTGTTMLTDGAASFSRMTVCGIQFGASSANARSPGLGVSSY